ncbi:unnamed protein product [Gulo gulo]|uniref:Uncharacterized protein n=1 Tax=Gulo gulo TaxID=48420 RepID=A0A9X9LE32_GULGU|nr:unnamed protein product [Gulo gulo]
MVPSLERVLHSMSELVPPDNWLSGVVRGLRLCWVSYHQHHQQDGVDSGVVSPATDPHS